MAECRAVLLLACTRFVPFEPVSACMSAGHGIFGAPRASQQGQQHPQQLDGSRVSGLDTMHSIGEALDDEPRL